MTDVRDTIRRLMRRPLTVLGLVIVLGMIFVALFAGQLAPHDPLATDFTAILAAPNSTYLMGTDQLGQDVLSRVIHGSQASLKAGLIAVGIAVAIGVPIGLLSGFYGGFWDEYIVMRLTDAMMAFPVIVLAIALAAVFGPGLTTAMVGIGIVYAPTFIRLTRGQVLAVREAEYVEAARALGGANRTLLWRHILPNITGPILVQASLSVASAILVEASLSFLGLGVQAPTPSWGNMLRLNFGYMAQAPWASIWPGMAIFVTVLGINLLGDGLRDMLDPRDVN